MAQEVYIRQKAVLDIDDVVGTVLVTANSTGTQLIWNKGGLGYIRTRTGHKARLAFVGNNVDPGGESVVTFHIYVNGNQLQPPYDSFTQALGITYDPSGRLVAPVDLPQNAMIEVRADNTDPATDYNAFIRLRIEYEDLSPI